MLSGVPFTPSHQSPYENTYENGDNFPYTSTTWSFHTLHGPSTSTASKLRRAASKRSGALADGQVMQGPMLQEDGLPGSK